MASRLAWGERHAAQWVPTIIFSPRATIAGGVGILSTSRDALVAMANILLVVLAGVALAGTEGLGILQWDRPLLQAAAELMGGAAVFFYASAVGLYFWERKVRKEREAKSSRGK